MNIFVSKTANYPPCRCVVCGSSVSDYFVDLGVSLELHFNSVIYNGPGFEGALLFCKEHWENLVRVGSKRVAQFLESENHESTRSDRPVIETDRATGEDDRPSELDDQQPTGGNPESDSDGSDEAVEEFAFFFGGRRS